MNSSLRWECLAIIAAATLGSTHSFAAETAPAPEGPARFNVLHIISDDLCSRLGCYGYSQVYTPNIDRLSQQGVRFDRAYCQYPLCNPSRSSFMTGLRPDTTKALNNQINFRDEVPDTVTLPQSFRKAGYTVARIGKIYHYGVPSQIGTNGMDDPASWEAVVNPKGRDIDDASLIEVLARGEDGKSVTATGKKLTDMGGTLSWLSADGGGEEQTDGKSATAAIQALEERAASGKSFYLAVGFFRPHTPFVAPMACFDRYPLDQIELPDNALEADNNFPAPALATRRPVEMAMDETLRKRAIQAYYASTTFMDEQVGRLLEALDRLKLRENTIVVFHSDHGYHLGEKGLWKKMTLFEESARVPLIISVPGNAANGKVCPRTVELVSLHKTLAGLCGIEAAPQAQGFSLEPLLADPQAPWEHPAYTQVVRETRAGSNAPEIVGRSVRTEKWRYTEWDNGSAGVELYDHETDPGERVNLAGKPDHADAEAAMRALLPRSSAGG